MDRGGTSSSVTVTQYVARFVGRLINRGKPVYTSDCDSEQSGQSSACTYRQHSFWSPRSQTGDHSSL